MVSNRSELSLSRTGIHGGIRRGTAAAAVGAVLVLSTGVQAALADDAVSPPQDPPVQASAAASAAAFGLTSAAVQGIPGRQEASRGDEDGAAGHRGDAPAGTPATPAPSPSISLPGTLLPVITGSATASTTPSPSPTASGTPLAPATRTTAPAAPTGTGSAPVAVRPGSPSASGAAGAANAPGAAPAAGNPNSAGAPAQSPAPASGVGTGGVPGRVDPAAGAPSAVSGAAGAHSPALPGIFGANSIAVGQEGATGGGANGVGTNDAAATPGPAFPTALSINARQSLPTRAPQAAGAPAGPGRAVSSTGPLPDVPDAMVWLGAGLVGVGAAAGLVFLRMRRL